MRIKGAFPVRWRPQDGRPGTGVTIVQALSFTKYADSNSGTTHPSTSSSEWKDYIPNIANGRYLWNWVHVHYSDGTYTDSFSASRMGIDGKGIQSSVVTYSLQENPVSPSIITNWGSFPSTLIDGYWLYTRTHIEYSDNEYTDSYSVAQVGVGSYYAGCQEYYAVSASKSTPPNGYPNDANHPYENGVAHYSNGEDISQYIGSSWSTTRPTTNATNPYIWNFEISYDSRGNKYVTQPICIGNFARGIVSIVETYTISSHSSEEDMLADVTERSDYPWSDENHSVVPNNIEPYKWNKTVVTYNDSTETLYHICAVKGADGKGSVYIDLDNENDSMLYDGEGNLIGNSAGYVTSEIYLYENGQRVTTGLPTFTVQCSAGVTASIISGTNTLRVTGITNNTGYVIVSCTYKNESYSAKMSLKRLVGVDKYELDLTQNSISYNETRQTISSTEIGVNVYRTAQNGTRDKVTNFAGLGLSARLWINGVSTNYRDITFNSSGNGTATITAQEAAQITKYAIVLYKSGQIIDRETIPINKVQDGPAGPGAIILDLENENDSMLYDGQGNKVSADVTSQAILLDGGVNKTADVTLWELISKENVTGNVNSSGLITITAVNATSGSAVCRATYGGKTYTAKITIKKLVGVDKYEIVCSPNAFTYNTTKQENQTQSINVKVYKTAQNGQRGLVNSFASDHLTLRYCYETSAGVFSAYTTINDGTGSGQYNGGVDRTIYAKLYLSYRYELLDANGVVLDVETVPISKNSDGEGKDAIILDLDNENDSMLYDGADNLVSDIVTSTASLYKGPTKVSSEITWSIDSVVGCTKMNNGTATNTTYSKESYPTAAWISTNGLVKVNGISATDAKVVVNAHYGNEDYKATLTIKKIKGVDKFDLVLKPAALTYNSSTQLVNGGSSVTVVAEIWRTAQNGERTKIFDYDSGNVHELSIEVTPSSGSVQRISQSYGVYFDVSSALAGNATNIAIVLKKDGVVQDSETIPVAKTSNGSGEAGPAAKSIYKLSFEHPATPTGATPSGWYDNPPTQDAVKITAQGDWVKGDDGYLRAPAIGTYQSNTETLSFITTDEDQKVYLRVKADVAAGSYVRIGKLDRGTVDNNDDYIWHISGSNQDTGDIEVNVPTAGTHFIILKYYRPTGTDNYVKVIYGMMSLWQSNAKTFNQDKTVSTWSTPFNANTPVNDEEVVQTRPNILKQSAFVSNRMNEWEVQEGSTTTGIDGRNSYIGNPNYEAAEKILLQQSIYDPNGDKPLEANSWYTLSFWAKANPYMQLTLNETSANYGFGGARVYLEAGVPCVLQIRGSLSQAAKNAGKVLKICVYKPNWASAGSCDITSTSATVKSISIDVSETGLYYIYSYVDLPNVGSSVVAGETATVEWYRIFRGQRIKTRLFPTTGTPSNNTAIDTYAGRIIDGKFENSSPADNEAEFMLSDAWSRHSLTFKTKNSIPSSVKQALAFILHEASMTTYICMPKLEKGTKATDYVINDSDMSEMAAEDTGFPNDRGQYVDDPSETAEGLYQWNDTRRDYVAYSINGEWKRYFVKRKGMVVPVNTPPTAGGNSYWEEGSKINTLLTNTFIGANCNIGGFLATNQKMRSSSVQPNGNPKILLDGENGRIEALEGLFTGFVRKGKATITTSNINDYKRDDIQGQTVLDFDKCGSFIQLNSGTAGYFAIPILSNYIATLCDETYKDMVRSFVGTTLLVYNKSGSVMNVTVNTYYSTIDKISPTAGVHSDNISFGTNRFFLLECKIGVDPVNEDENVYWQVISSGTIV